VTVSILSPLVLPMESLQDVSPREHVYQPTFQADQRELYNRHYTKAVLEQLLFDGVNCTKPRILSRNVLLTSRPQEFKHHSKLRLPAQEARPLHVIEFHKAFQSSGASLALPVYLTA
jgi:hypothetical protein